MQIRILGPLEVTDGEHPIDIGAPKQRLLLTVLALEVGRVVSADRLLDELWGDSPPSGGVKTLHYHVSKLRDTLQPNRAVGEEGVIVTSLPGYALMVSAGDVDAARFEREVLDARRLIEFDPGHAAARLRDALGLWRGPFPAELLNAPRSGLAAHRLEELRLSALEDRIGADLAAGRHAEVVPEVEALTGEHPLRERLWAQYMVALYRCDRQADSLRAYQLLRTHLREELGIEPSPDLRRLEDAILLQDPDLDVPEGLQRPTSLRGYELRERIGEGAFGFVWRASQVSIDREVAVKVVRPEHSNRPGSVLGFQAQAQLLASLDHPQMVPVFDFWRDPDGAYLVMPLMAGGSLANTDTMTWDTPQVVKAIEQITSGLAHAHRLGYVHADLHPGNVLFDSDRNAYLADFGLAINMSAGGSTPPAAYSSPEQMRGELAGPATDVFALGRLAYRAFTGISPGRDPLPGIRSVRPDVREAVDTVLRRATHPEPARRHRDAAEFLDDFHRALGREPVPVGEPRNPYKGLRPFTEADAADFLGRDDLVDELVGAVTDRRLVAVVGPSGSGKSSLVRAGLIPGLRAGRAPGSDQWLFADLYPGADPAGALAEALRSVAVHPVPHPSHPDWDSDRVAAMVRGVLPPGVELVLVVDQFEELFTLCSAESERVRFMAVLLALVGDPGSRTRVVLTLRADYYGLPLEHRAFGEALRGAVVAVTPPGPEQLTQAVIGPSAAVGVTVEPDVAADLAGDVAAQPGGLPLMEHALTRLFDERSGPSIGTADYRRIGGLTEALAGWPEGLFTALDSSTRTVCRQVFLRLVGIDDTGQESRRRVSLAELYGLGIDPAAVDQVVDAFSDARLLTLDRDPLSRTPTVEVAHEALFTRWERLRSWIEEQREALIMGRRFRTALADWEHSGRDPEYLLRGGRLRQFETWSRQSGLAIAEAETEYLRAGRVAEEASGEARRRRRRVVAAGLGLLGVMAAGFAVAATIQRARATDQQLVAELQERIARSRSLAASSAAQVDRDPELAVMLALQAIETTRGVDGTVLREAEEALHAALNANRLVSNVPAEMWTRTVAYAPDGSRYYLGGFQAGQIVAAPSGRVEGEFVIPPTPETPDESHIAELAIAGEDDELLVVAHYSPSGISVIDAESLETLYTLEGGCCWITDIAVGGDGTTLAGIDPVGGLVFVWDLRTRSRIAELSLDCPSECPRGVALNDDGTVVTSGNTVWSVATGEVLLSGIDATSIADVEMLDEARMILASGSTALIVDLESGETLQTLRGHHADISAIDVALDGATVATGAQDGLVLLWRLKEPESGPWLILSGHTGIVWEVRFSPDGRHLTSTAGRQQMPEVLSEWPRDWEARTWDVTVGGIGEWLAGAALASDVDFGPGAGTVVVAGTPLGAGMWDLESATNTVTFRGWAENSRITAVAAAPAGIALGGVRSSGGPGAAGWVAVFDPATGAMTTELISPTPGLEPKDLAFSTDGSALAVAATGLAQVWDTASWEVRFTPSDTSTATDYTAVAFHADPNFLFTQFRHAAPGAPGGGELWDLSTGSVMPTFLGHIPRGDLGSLAVSPDGRLLVVAGDGRPEIVEPFTFRVLAQLAAAPAQAVTAAFAPDGTTIATGESDGTVRLWDAVTGAERLVLSGHVAQVNGVAFSPDGSRLVSVGLDGVVRVWALDLDDLMSLARSRVGREFTDAECRAYIGVGCAPSEAPVRLVPATAEWGRPFGIPAASWDSAEAGGVWSELDMSGRGLAGSFALDPTSRRLFAFNDPSDGTSWSLDLASGEVAEVATLPAPSDPNLPPDVEPWPATLGAMVYHPGRNSIITTRVEDGVTVAFDVTTGSWSELTRSQDPFVGRYGYGLAYDPESDLIVLFGGAEWGRVDEGKHTGLGDTWVFDVAAAVWTEVTPPVSPPPRIDAGLAYDTGSDRIVLFGGHTAFGGDVLGDTWAYDTNTNTWTEMTPAASPPSRSGLAMWYDPGHDLVFVFGGSADASSYPPLPWMVFGGEELWSYDLDTDDWTLHRAEPNPAYRTGAWAGFDVVDGRAILVGGDRYDADRRYVGSDVGLWAYLHRGG